MNTWKKLSLALCLVVLFSCMASAAIKDSPEGFRGIKWGNPPSALGEAAIVIENHDVIKITVYSRQGDKMSLGSAELVVIGYVFWDNKLMGVAVRANHGEFENLKDVATEKFGLPEPPGEYVDAYSWGDDKVFIHLKESYEPELLIVSIPLSDEFSAFKEQLAQQAAAEDF